VYCSSSGADEDQQHVLCDCALHDAERQVLFDRISVAWASAHGAEYTWPREEAVRLGAWWPNMNSYQRCVWLLSASEPRLASLVATFIHPNFSESNACRS
jgi:hypothetical protein